MTFEQTASNPKDSSTSNMSTSERDIGNAEGKQVAKNQPVQQSPRQADGDTFVSRLGKSAAELSRSVLQGSSTSSADLVAFSSSSGKPGPSSSVSSRDSHHAATTSSSAGVSSASSSFRPGHTDSHVAAEEAAFSAFLDGTSVTASKEAAISNAPWETANETSSQEPSYTAHEPLHSVANSTAQQQQQDGAEVVQLLLQVDEDGPGVDDQMQIDSETLDNLRRALFETGASTQIPASIWNNMLNFIPDFLREDDAHSTQAVKASSMNLGVADRAEASQLWLEEWNRVLTSYTDEVWGDLGNLAQAARTEIQQSRSQPPSQRTEPRAVRQLQSVLRRVRARL